MALKYSEIKAIKQKCSSIGELKRKCLEKVLFRKVPIESAQKVKE